MEHLQLLYAILTILGVASVSTFLVIWKWSRIKRSYLIWKIKDRRKKKAKFTFDNQKQERTVKMIERLLRDPNSTLEHNKDIDNYYIVNGDIYGVFNRRYVSIINGKYDNTTLIYDALYESLRTKYENRKRLDVLKLEIILDKKFDNILDFINDDIQENTKKGKKDLDNSN